MYHLTVCVCDTDYPAELVKLSYPYLRRLIKNDPQINSHIKLNEINDPVFEWQNPINKRWNYMSKDEVLPNNVRVRVKQATVPFHPEQLACESSDSEPERAQPEEPPKKRKPLSSAANQSKAKQAAAAAAKAAEAEVKRKRKQATKDGQERAILQAFIMFQDEMRRTPATKRLELWTRITAEANRRLPPELRGDEPPLKTQRIRAVINAMKQNHLERIANQENLHPCNSSASEDQANQDLLLLVDFNATQIRKMEPNEDRPKVKARRGPKPRKHSTPIKKRKQKVQVGEPDLSDGDQSSGDEDDSQMGHVSPIMINLKLGKVVKRKSYDVEQDQDEGQATKKKIKTEDQEESNRILEQLLSPDTDSHLDALPVQEGTVGSNPVPSTAAATAEEDDEMDLQSAAQFLQDALCSSDSDALD